VTSRDHRTFANAPAGGPTRRRRFVNAARISRTPNRLLEALGLPQPARGPEGRAPEGAFAARLVTACGKPIGRTAAACISPSARSVNVP